MTNPFVNLLSPNKGGYSSNQVTETSHYYNPILTGNGFVTGNSRNAGDASAQTQETSINAIIQAAAAQNLDQSDTALLLAIIKEESGFNPDAAAGPTTAFGLGQTTNATAALYGLTTPATMWNINDQAYAAVNFFIYCKNQAATLGLDDTYIYALWHDGQNIKDVARLGSGEGFYYSTNDVIPAASQFLSILQKGGYGLPITDGTEINPYTTSVNADGLATLQTTVNNINYSLAYMSNGGSCLTTTTSNGVTYEYSDAGGANIFSIVNPVGGTPTINMPSMSVLMPFITTLTPAIDDYSYLIKDNNGNTYTLTGSGTVSTTFSLTSSNGNIDVTLDPSTIGGISATTSGLSVNLPSGINLLLNYQTGSGTINLNGSTETISQPSTIQIDPDSIRVAPTNNYDGYGIDYGITPTGTLNGSKQGFLGLQDDLNFAQAQTDATSLSSAVASIVYTPTGTYSDNYLPVINVFKLSQADNSQGSMADTSPQVANGLVLAGQGL